METEKENGALDPKLNLKVWSSGFVSRGVYGLVEGARRRKNKVVSWLEGS
jgi:hypothetical protein